MTLRQAHLARRHKARAVNELGPSWTSLATANQRLASQKTKKESACVS